MSLGLIDGSGIDRSLAAKVEAASAAVAYGESVQFGAFLCEIAVQAGKHNQRGRDARRWHKLIAGADLTAGASKWGPYQYEVRPPSAQQPIASRGDSQFARFCFEFVTNVIC